MNFPALVLAAGASRRMGFPKALLRIGERTVLEHVVLRLRDAGFDPVLTILGHYREELGAVLGRMGAAAALNLEPDGGPIGSIRVGLQALPSAIPGVLVHPVDHPGVAEDTLAALLEAIQAHPDRIVVPSYGRRRGHPTWFPAGCLPELLDPALQGGARSVLQRDPARIIHLEVDDPGILVDLDTPEDWDRFQGTR